MVVNGGGGALTEQGGDVVVVEPGAGAQGHGLLGPRIDTFYARTGSRSSRCTEWPGEHRGQTSRRGPVELQVTFKEEDGRDAMAKRTVRITHQSSGVVIAKGPIG